MLHIDDASATVQDSHSAAVVVTTANSAPTTPSTTASIPTHRPVWVAVKYRPDPVDIAHPRFVYVNGGSSSLVRAAFYDPANNYMVISLDGTSYHYCGMPDSVWSAFKASSSLGSFYNTEVNVRYDCRSGHVPAY